MPDTLSLVSPEWLAQQDGDLVILDASWYLPAMERDARAEFAAEHIKGAQFFDIDEHSDATSDLPHTMPSAAQFEQAAQAFGVNPNSQIVVYDGMGLFSAARVWWMFRAMGHDNIAVLNGGLPAWKAAGFETTTETHTPELGTFTAAERAGMIRSAESLKGVQIADARPADRFAGAVPEPRDGVRAGHIPGASNTPFPALLDDGKLKDADALRRIFETAGLDLDHPIVTSCGSGVTGTIINLALTQIGHKEHALYDGSWTEWGGRPDLPLETGPSTQEKHDV